MGTRNRDIIVKFATYRSRQNLYKLRTKLKDTGHEGEFVNEDLTRFKSGVLFEARKLAKLKFVQGAWTSDGNILVKDNSDDVHRISSLSDLFRFGYLLMNPNQIHTQICVALTRSNLIVRRIRLMVLSKS